MAVSTLVAASSGKTRYFKSFTSSTSWTVPAGVTYVNVTCIGGGGGGGGAGSYVNLSANDGSAGSTTTFSTLSASGGEGGLKLQDPDASGYQGGSRIGQASAANSGLGGGSAYRLMRGTSTIHGALIAKDGINAQILSDTITVTPGASVSYTVGAGGAGATSSNTSYAITGGNGGSGRIDIEWWA